MANCCCGSRLPPSMGEAEETGEHSLKRSLGPWSLIALGIGAIIGAGIFVLTGPAAARYAGPGGGAAALSSRRLPASSRGSAMRSLRR